MALATGLWLMVHGCDSVEGGAVELSWKLRPASSSLPDKFVDCDSDEDGTGPVTDIRLHWQVGDASADEQWPCGDNYGVTHFDLPEGEALLSVLPVCMDGPAAPDSYIVPAPARRDVKLGDTVSLGAVELVVVVTDCSDQTCICGAPPVAEPALVPPSATRVEPRSEPGSKPGSK